MTPMACNAELIEPSTITRILNSKVQENVSSRSAISADGHTFAQCAAEVMSDVTVEKALRGPDRSDRVHAALVDGRSGYPAFCDFLTARL